MATVVEIIHSYKSGDVTFKFSLVTKEEERFDIFDSVPRKLEDDFSGMEWLNQDLLKCVEHAWNIRERENF